VRFSIEIWEVADAGSVPEYDWKEEEEEGENV